MAVSTLVTVRATPGDLGPGRGGQQRPHRARARGVAGRAHPVGRAVGEEAEHERVERVDVAAERAGQPDRADVVQRRQPGVVHQQPHAGLQRGLGQLDGAHVVLGDAQRGSTVARLVQHVGEDAAVLDDPRRARGQRAVDGAVGVEHPGQEQLGDDLDDPGAAHAGDAGRWQVLLEPVLVRPAIAADHADAGLERVAVDPHPLDGARRRPLPARDLRALERGAGRAGRGEQPLPLAEHDLGVGARRRPGAAPRRCGAGPRRGWPPRRRPRRGRRCRAGRGAGRGGSARRCPWPGRPRPGRWRARTAPCPAASGRCRAGGGA